MRTGLALTIITLVNVLVSGQTAPPAPPLPGFMWAAYPELRAAPLQLRDGPELGDVTIAVLTSELGDPAVVSRPRNVALIARLQVDDRGALQRLIFHGPLTRESARAALIGLHGTDPATQATALRTAGAVYGPDQQSALEPELPLAALSSQLGQVRLGRASFDDSAAPLEWTFELLGDAAVAYRMTVEPFAGRITSIVRQGGTQ